MSRGCCILAVTLLTATAHAQRPRDALASPVPREVPARAAEPADPPPGDAPWVLDDGNGFDAVPWDPLPTGSPLVPRGPIHLGATLRVAVLPADSSPAPDGPQVELGVLVDFRLRDRSRFHFRAALAAIGRPHAQVWRGGGVTESSGPLGLRLRLWPLAVDLADWLSVRVGIAVSVEWIPGPLEDLAGFGGGTDVEIVARFFEGQLEAGLTGGLQLDAMSRTTREGIGPAVAPEPMIGLVGSWIWP